MIFQLSVLKSTDWSGLLLLVIKGSGTHVVLNTNWFVFVLHTKGTRLQEVDSSYANEFYCKAMAAKPRPPKKLQRWVFTYSNMRGHVSNI